MTVLMSSSQKIIALRVESSLLLPLIAQAFPTGDATSPRPNETSPSRPKESTTRTLQRFSQLL